MGKIIITINSISEWTGKLVSFLVIPLMVIIIFEITMRFLFNMPTIWVHDLSGYLFAALFMIGGAYTLRYGGHVNMDIIAIRLSQRKRAILDIVTFPMIILIAGVIAWKTGAAAIEAIRYGFNYGSTWAPPMWPLKGAVALGAALLILQAFVKLIKDIYIAATGEAYES